MKSCGDGKGESFKKKSCLLLTQKYESFKAAYSSLPANTCRTQTENHTVLSKYQI